MLKEFLDCFNVIINFEDYGIEEDNNFYTNETLNNLFGESSD